jgi:hypothetical protein
MRVRPEQIDRAAELIRQGVHPREAAQTVALSMVAVWDHLRRRGISFESLAGPAILERRRRGSESRRRAATEDVLALRAEGLTFAQIGERLGISRQRAFQIGQEAQQNLTRIMPENQ